MTGETDLATLLNNLRPVLDEKEYVFLTQQSAAWGDGAELAPIASFVEDEGLTLVVPRQNADEAGLSYEGVFRRMTLQVHSSLQAVGLTAAVATALARRNISANVIAAFYHDHIFVPSARADDALQALTELKCS